MTSDRGSTPPQPTPAILRKPIPGSDMDDVYAVVTMSDGKSLACQCIVDHDHGLVRAELWTRPDCVILAILDDERELYRTYSDGLTQVTIQGA